MKKRILQGLIVVMLLSTSINVLAVDNQENNMKTCFESDKISFSQVSVISDGEYLNLEISEANDLLRITGSPQLPYFTKTYVYPFGTKILDVKINPKTIFEQKIDKKIKPASKPVPKIKISSQNVIVSSEDERIYSSNTVFPSAWYSYDIRCGIKDGKRYVFLTINLFPVRYSPSEDLLYKTTDFDVNIEFIKPENEFKTYSDNYDLVIIAPKSFSRALHPLIKHKNSYGVRTILKTTNSIYSEFSGRDDAEKIKYFIKNAIEEWNVTYVLLVGGRVGQLFKWYIPPRYTALDDWSDWEISHLSDLYYADVYKYNMTSHQYEFEDWDSNGNGVFAEWSRDSYHPEDEIDLVPDVYVGRLACRNIHEVKILVNKIKTYESDTYGKDWFKNMILVGGDTVPTTNENSSDYSYYEGEIETNLGGSFLEPLGFNIIRLWASNGNLTGQSDVIKTLSKGAGFLYLSGHGNPNVWSTHPPNNNSWIDALFNFGMPLLRNKNKLPVCVVGGCHNSQFDVTNLNIIKGIIEEGSDYFSQEISIDSGGFWKNEWAHRCWSWNLVRQKNGGAIACIGNTGLGWGSGGLSCVNDLDGWITSHFFKNYAALSQMGNYSLGEIHSQTITDYINTFSGSWDRLDSKTVEGWVLLGDPSLRIGGYPPIH